MNGDPNDEVLDLRYYLGVVRRRALVIVVTFIVAVGAAVGLSLVQDEQYEASTEVLIQRKVSDQVFDPVLGFDPDRNVQTEVKILKSRTVREAAAQALGHEPDVSISSDDTSDVVSVNARSGDPEQAAADADAYAEAYVAYRTRSTVENLLAAGQEVQAKIDEIDRELELLAPDSGQRSALDDQRAYLVQQLGRLQVSANLAGAGGAEIVAVADVPESPVSPKPVRNGLVGALLGLLLGVGLAFLRDHLDDGIDDRGDLERAVRGAVPVIGEIPAVAGWKKKDGAHLVSRADPTSGAAESYRTLRTSLQFLAIDPEVKSFQVTSARAEEGKTTTLANLGVALARAGQKVLIVCADLRRPRVHEFFGLGNEVGLTSVLLGDTPLTKAFQRVDGEPRLALLASGPPPPNPSELLASPEVRDIVTAVERVADIVLVDSPPVLPVSDALVVASLVDAVVLVAFSGESSRRAVHRAYELLRQVDAPVRGLVLNNADVATSRYGYGRYGYSSRPPVSSNGAKRRRTPIPEAPDPDRAVAQRGGADPLTGDEFWRVQGRDR